MLHLALCALLVGCQDEDRAPTARPNDGLLYIESPDLAGLLKAYPNAPLMQMIHDEAVRSTVASLLEAGGLQVGPSVTKALAKLGVPQGMADAPLESLNGVLKQLQSVSLSVSLTGGTEAVAADLSKSIEAMTTLAKLQYKVKEFMQANQGFPPGELAELKLPDEELQDPWGRPYVIDVDMATLAFQLSSLGADGVPGGTGFGEDLSTDKAHAELAEELFVRTLDVVAQVEFTTQENAQVAWQQIAQLLEAHLGKTTDAESELSVRGKPARARDFPNLPGSAHGFWMLGMERRIALGYGPDSRQRLLSRLQTESGKFAPSPELGAMASNLSAAKGATVVQGWAELDRLNTVLEGLAKGMEARGEERVEFFPIAGSGVFRSQLDGERFVSEFAYRTPASAVLANCVGATPVPASLWEFIPSESIGVFATSIDGNAIYEEVLARMGTAPGERPKALAELEEKHGFSIDKDLIGNLGGGGAAYLLPISGVLSVPVVAAVVELRDAEAFHRGLKGVLELLEAQAGGEFSVKYKPYRDQPLWTFSFGGEGGLSGPVAISPSLSIVKNHLLICLTSTRAKKEIKRLMDAEETQPHRVLALKSGPPKDASSIVFMDWPALVDGTYEGARAALTMFAGMMEDLPLDPESLPAASIFTRFFQPTVGWTRQVAPAVRLVHVESSFGPETALGVLGGAGALAVAVQEMQAAGKQNESAEQVTDPDVVAAIRDSRRTLEQVATRLEVFKLETGTYPRSLAELIKPTQKYPRGYLEGGQVPGDGWGRDLVYLPAVDSSSYTLWSLGENGQDERGAGDDLILH